LISPYHPSLERPDVPKLGAPIILEEAAGYEHELEVVNPKFKRSGKLSL
jgi:hypothetical protein